jgi:hypothetical protein
MNKPTFIQIHFCDELCRVRCFTLELRFGYSMKTIFICPGEASDMDSVKVDSARQIRRIEPQSMYSCVLHFVHQYRYLLAENIEYCNPYAACSCKVIPHGRKSSRITNLDGMPIDGHRSQASLLCVRLPTHDPRLQKPDRIERERPFAGRPRERYRAQVWVARHHQP